MAFDEKNEEDYLDSLLRGVDEQLNTIHSNEEDINEAEEVANLLKEVEAFEEAEVIEEAKVDNLFDAIGTMGADLSAELAEDEDISILESLLQDITAEVQAEEEQSTEEQPIEDTFFDDLFSKNAETEDIPDNEQDIFKQLGGFDLFESPSSDDDTSDNLSSMNDDSDFELLKAISILNNEASAEPLDEQIEEEEASSKEKKKKKAAKEKKEKPEKEKNKKGYYIDKVKEFIAEQGEDTEEDIAAYEAKEASRAEKKAAKEAAKAEKKAAKEQKKLEENAAKQQKKLEKNTKKEAKKAAKENADEPRYAVTLVKFILLITIIFALVIVLWAFTDYNHRRIVKKNATNYFMTGQYELAYEEIADIRPEDNDEILFEQIRTIMYLQKQYNSYLNFYNIDMKDEALDALIKGVDKYDKYYENAVELGILEDMDYVLGKLETELIDVFGVTLEKARALSNIEDSVEYSLAIREILK